MCVEDKIFVDVTSNHAYRESQLVQRSFTSLEISVDQYEEGNRKQEANIG